MIKQAKLRLTLYGCWVASLLLCVAVLLSGPLIRRDASLGFEQVYPVIPAAIGLHLPALSAFAAYWFPQEERARAKKVSIDKERAFGAISITLVYIAIVVAHLVWATILINYDSASLNISEQQTFVARINDAVKTALMLSPLAIAPSAYLTRLGAPVNEKAPAVEDEDESERPPKSPKRPKKKAAAKPAEEVTGGNG